MSDEQRCYNCKHWQGDRDRFEVWKRNHLGEFGHVPLSDAMDPRDGWAPDGDCAELRIQFGVIGRDLEHGREVTDIPAGFGCVLWESRDE